MDTWIFLTGIAALVVAVGVLAPVLGWFFTEVIVLPLNFKPFNCMQCLSFWFSVLLNFGLSWMVSPCFMALGLVQDLTTIVYGFTGIGVLEGLVVYQYIKLKYRVYD